MQAKKLVTSKNTK